MSVIDRTMDTMIGALPREKREEMMIAMMPLMMEGIDMNELMPRMVANMLKDVTADDIVNWLKQALADKERLAKLGSKLQEANLMGRMMFRVDVSRLGFEETVAALSESAEQNGWQVPDTRDIQDHYRQSGLDDMTRCTVLYFCYPQGAYRIFTSSDENKAFSVMMPMGVSVYETTEGEVRIASMNLSLMSSFFGGAVKEVLIDGGARYERSLEAVTRPISRGPDRSFAGSHD